MSISCLTQSLRQLLPLSLSLSDYTAAEAGSCCCRLIQVATSSTHNAFRWPAIFWGSCCWNITIKALLGYAYYYLAHSSPANSFDQLFWVTPLRTPRWTFFILDRLWICSCGQWTSSKSHRSQFRKQLNWQLIPGFGLRPTESHQAGASGRAPLRAWEERHTGPCPIQGEYLLSHPDQVTEFIKLSSNFLNQAAQRLIFCSTNNHKVRWM